MIPRRTAACFAYILILANFTAHAQEQEARTEAVPAPSTGLQKVVGEGFAANFGLDARAEALRAAELDALEMFLDSLLGMENTGPARVLLQNPSAYVQSSRATAYEDTASGVRVQAEVYIKTLEARTAAARALYAALPKPPTVSVLIAEDLVGERALNIQAEPGPAEQTFLEGFAVAGFKTLDPALLRQNYNAPELMLRLQTPETAGGKFARETGAEFAVLAIGRTTVEGESPTQTSVQVRAKLQAWAVRASDGAVVDSAITEGVCNGDGAEAAAVALRDAAEKAQRLMQVGIVLGSVGVASSQDYVLTVLNPPSMDFAGQLASNIGQDANVSEVEVLHVTRREASIRIVFSGALKDLADGVMGVAPAPFRLEPQQIYDRTLVFRALGPSREGVAP